MNESIFWWLQYLRVFALNTPWGTPVKFTIGVSAHDGEKLAVAWKKKPVDIVDGYGRPSRQIETEDRLIAVEWLTPKEETPVGSPSTWGMMPPQLPKR